MNRFVPLQPAGAGATAAIDRRGIGTMLKLASRESIVVRGTPAAVLESLRRAE